MIYFLDKFGYPVTRFKNRPIVNFMRLLINTRKRPKCLDPTLVEGCTTPGPAYGGNNDL